MMKTPGDPTIIDSVAAPFMPLAFPHEHPITSQFSATSPEQSLKPTKFPHSASQVLSEFVELSKSLQPTLHSFLGFLLAVLPVQQERQLQKSSPFRSCSPSPKL